MRWKNVVANFRERSLGWCVKHYLWRAWRILTHDGWQQLYGLYLFGHRVAVPLNARVGGTQYMKIGAHCGFATHLWLECIDHYGTGEEEQHFHPELIIGDRVSIGEFVHIGCVHHIEIGNDVLMGSKIYITDHNHGVYNGEHPSRPAETPAARRLTDGESIYIGDRVWIGEFVTVLPGVTIGAGTIIGTHSTVTHDVPPNSIAVGSPARVIKQWDDQQHAWVRVPRIGR